MSQKRRTLSSTFLINMTLLTFFAVSVFVYIWLSHVYRRFERDVAELRTEYIESRKTRLKNEVERTLNYIRYMNSSTEERLKNLIRERVHEAHSIAMNIYNENKGRKEDAEIIKMIKDALRPVRFNSGRGYYFAGNFNGIEQLFADRPEMEGKDLSAMQDTLGRYVIQDMIRIAKEKGEGFYSYTWTKPEELGKDFPKIAFVKHFEPYQWFIGTGEYLDSMKKDIQEEAMRRLVNLRFEKEGYIFGSTYKGEPLFSNGKITAGGPSIWELTDPNGIKIIQEQRKIAENPEGGFHTYSWHKLDEPRPSPKISFVKGIPEWEWIIGAGVYVDEVEAVIREKREMLEARIRNYMLRVFCIFLTLLVLISLTAWYMSRRIMGNLNVFFSFFETAATSHCPVELRSLHYAEFENLALSANRMIEERMRIESALRKSEERFRSIFEYAAVGIAYLETDGQFIIANEKFCRITAYEPGELQSLSFHDIIHADERESGIRLLRDLLNGKIEKISKNNRYIRKDRRVIWGNVTVSLVRRNTGEPDCLIAVLEDISQRKEMEQSLRHSESRYRELFGNMSSGVAVYEAVEEGEDFVFRDFNRGGERIENIRKENLIGKKVTEMFPGVREFGLFEVFQRVWRTGIPEHHPIHLYQDDRITGWRENYVYKLPTGEIVSMYDDITERMQAEEALRESEERYRALVHASPAAISIFQDGYMVFTNPAGARIFGFSDPKECSGKPAIEYIAPQCREIIMERIRNLDKFRPNQRTEIEIIRTDGSTLPIESVSVPVKVQNRKAALIICQDISERKKAEEELRNTKNYLDNILRSSPYAIIGLNQEERITVFNPAAEKLSGVRASEAQGGKFSDVMADFRECAEDIRTVMHRRQPVIRERVKKEKNGEIRYYDIIIYSLTAEGTQGAVLRIDSVTERIRFEEMMIQTEKMMSVGGLAAGMAHEINNPLGGILQSTQNILRRISPDLPANVQTAAECGTTLDTVRAYLEKRNIIGFLDGIRFSGQKAAEIVQNMLSFSRRSESRMAPADLALLLDKTVELAAHDYDLKKKYDFRQIEIIRDFPENFPKVNCVATEIEQVILNLLRNAAHAMSSKRDPQRPSLISLRLRKEGDNARIEVADNGPGMEEKIRRRIFEPFFTTKEVGQGTGLGLSVSYFIITSNHKGSMHVESEPGKGSCFVIHLPF
ncbi:MAG: cache domain-containing protein [Desulfobacterales bacterium]